MGAMIPFLSGQDVTPGSIQAGNAISGLGSSIANIGNAASGVVPQTATGTPATNPTGINKNIAPSMTAPGVPPAVAHAMQGNVTGASPVGTIASPQQTSTIPTQASPTAPVATTPGQVPAPAGTGIGTYNPGDVNSVYGMDTGTALGNLLNSENPTGANSTAQAIIAANAPNVAEGAANLNTQLAAGGISPSSSVSAIENANYQGQVAQQDQAELANIGLTEQQQQQQLLETLLPSQQQRQTDSSGWSIFGDVMSGIGDVATLGLGSL